MIFKLYFETRTFSFIFDLTSLSLTWFVSDQPCFYTLNGVGSLSLCAIKLIDAEPPSFSPGNEKVTCKAIERQILAQTPVDVSGSSLNTENIRSLVVCDILITIPICKKRKRCGGLSVRKAHYSFNHHCFPNNGNKNLNCGFSATCC